ncbi:MAG: MATE family efflux transporter, partial [Eubacteriales bacterium]|nr:MATE family efflux transporter [Eubacteriales bacterium]
MIKGEKMLANAPVGKVIWKLALPAILTTLISTIYNLTDTYFIGLTRDTAQLSAVSAAMPYMWLFSALWGVFAAGA